MIIYYNPSIVHNPSIVQVESLDAIQAGLACTIRRAQQVCLASAPLQSVSLDMNTGPHRSVMWHKDQKSVRALVLAIVNEAQTL